MIEDTIWARFDAPTQLLIKQAFVVIAKSGVLEAQAKLEQARLLDGDPGETLEELAKEILRVRADTRGLQTVHHYGLQLTQELEQGIES